ncbi:RNA polymerase sigma-70 factor (ECF subfamily) [Kineothrix alysoides]|uniref:RNA polymerase sigma-70 factor (ECF subfamily) n=1 Tax=Kineothrix alysoides TaxID=1469948 RepID=A0A4R1QW92_9FIRM|nr:sigma-70 family RNA polymerase sigma factor [Kineothrix alysoides]TCL57541.1 RNA polymerase sigma-70 factor (ECF subfamily) [Kineothrix alysoides]
MIAALINVTKVKGRKASGFIPAYKADTGLYCAVWGGVELDKQNMEQIYEENVSVVYKYLFCLTQDAYLAEELTQETFYQAIRGIQKFRGDCKISVWLCQIGKRLWYKELERRKKKTVSIDELTEKISEEDLEEQYLMKCDKVELFRKIYRLEGKVREVMYLRLTGELSFAEIGEIMGVTENWARVTFYRGKQKILKGEDS